MGTITSTYLILLASKICTSFFYFFQFVTYNTSHYYIKRAFSVVPWCPLLRGFTVFCVGYNGMSSPNWRAFCIFLKMKFLAFRSISISVFRVLSYYLWPPRRLEESLKIKFNLSLYFWSELFNFTSMACVQNIFEGKRKMINEGKDKQEKSGSTFEAITDHFSFAFSIKGFVLVRDSFLSSTFREFSKFFFVFILLFHCALLQFAVSIRY